MNKISEGYFYDVFDLGNGRVLKKKRSFLRIVKSTGGIVNAIKHVRSNNRSTKQIRKMLGKIPPALLGNPVFKNKADYEQNTVILLMDYFASHSIAESKAIIDKYFQLIERLLGHGIHDYVYKFKNSYGVDQEGNVVFIDFNEVVFSRQEVLALVDERRWQTEAQFKKFPEGELKEHLRQKFTTTLTKENIERLWNKFI